MFSIFGLIYVRFGCSGKIETNDTSKMPVRTEIIPPPAQSKQLGFPKTLLYNGSKFEGSQKSKGNSYAVEVVLQVAFSIQHLISQKCQLFTTFLYL